jgi:hypothetical protein
MRRQKNLGARRARASGRRNRIPEAYSGTHRRPRDRKTIAKVVLLHRARRRIAPLPTHFPPNSESGNPAYDRIVHLAMPSVTISTG